MQQEGSQEAGRAGEQEVRARRGGVREVAQRQLEVLVYEVAVAVRDRVGVRRTSLRAAELATQDLGDPAHRGPAAAGAVHVDQAAVALLDLERHPHRQQRGATECAELVVDADLLDAEQLTPDVRDVRDQVVLGGRDLGGWARGCGLRDGGDRGQPVERRVPAALERVGGQRDPAADHSGCPTGPARRAATPRRVPRPRPPRPSAVTT